MLSFQIIYETSVAAKGLDFIFKVKNRIGKYNESASLEDLLKPHLVDDDCLKKISFDLEFFNIEQLAYYLVDSNSQRCAVCFLNDSQGPESQTEIGHAVNMYNYVCEENEEYFCYKDSSIKAYLSYDEEFPDQGLKLHSNNFENILRAWTFTAKYNEDA